MIWMAGKKRNGGESSQAISVGEGHWGKQSKRVEDVNHED